MQDRTRVSSTTGPAPLVVRASAYFWLGSALMSGIVPLILMGTQLPGGILLWIGLALVVLFTAALSWAAMKLLRGAGWARNVLTGVAVVSLLNVFVGSPSGLAFTGLALTLGGTILMWLPASSAYFRLRPAPAGT